MFSLLQAHSDKREDSPALLKGLYAKITTVNTVWASKFADLSNSFNDILVASAQTTEISRSTPLFWAFSVATFAK